MSRGSKQSAVRTQEKRDYYEVLGVPRDAGPERIREAYLALSRRFHPDVANEEQAPRRFHEIAEAYQVLSRRDSKLLYDRLAYRGPGNRGFGPPHPGVGKPTADSTHVSDDELLDWIFTGRRPGRASEVVGELRLGSIEARRGTQRTVAFEALTPCVDCDGRGTATLARATRPCPECAGTGRQRVVSADSGKLTFGLDVCDDCDGSGRMPHAEECAACEGVGATVSKRKRSVYIPAGVRDGQELVVDRVAGLEDDDRNAVVVLRVSNPRRSHKVIQIGAVVLLLTILAVIAVLLLAR
jgi:molecular chaperone DnaJ